MTITISRILSIDEFNAIDDDAMSKGFYRHDRRVFKPGMAWYQPWYWSPGGTYVSRGEEHRCRFERGKAFLSPHYWRDWADKRPPICVVCPNGEQWEIDRKSSNGDGWKVSGEYESDNPKLIVTPSIVVEGYHGFLGSNGAPPGQFTGDLEGRGPTGISRVYA